MLGPHRPAQEVESMRKRSFSRVVATCFIAVIAAIAVSCSSGSPGNELSRSPAASGDDGIPDTGPTTATPVPESPPSVEPPSTEPSTIERTPAPTSGGEGGGDNGYFFSLDGTYQVEADRVVLDAGRFLVVAPKVWMGATDETKFPKGSFLATDTGAFLSSGGTWTNASSRQLKDGLRPVRGAAVLRALGRLPVSTWHYRSEAPGVRHMGPMAEDFARAFHLGQDSRHIATVDSEGVALAALKALATTSARQHDMIASLRAELRGLAARVADLEAGHRAHG
jgi:hypothetical protein